MRFRTANFACKAEGLRLDFTSTFRSQPKEKVLWRAWSVKRI